MGITLEKVSYTYQANTPLEGRALFDIDLSIEEGEFYALIGHTGSGKSTILQLLNGLNVPSEGTVTINGTRVTKDSSQKGLKDVRKQVGLVFQFPESQLFEETVLKDVAFGPQNFGVSPDEAEKIAAEKLALVGIGPELFEQSPFSLSGGQMRRVAIAGILAMEPNILVLDEPTAGLDPAGRKELLSIFEGLHKDGLTIVLVTHMMDDVADYADQVFVLEKGHLVRSGRPKEIFQEVDYLESIQLGVPKATRFAWELRQKGMSFEQLPITMDELVEELTHE